MAVNNKMAIDAEIKAKLAPEIDKNGLKNFENEHESTQMVKDG